MFTFNTKPECRLGKARPNRSYCGSSYETGGLVHHVSDTEGAHTPRHERLLSPQYEMSVVWDEPCLFSVIEDATPIESGDSYQGEADRSRFPPRPSSWLLERGSHSPSHDPTLTHAYSVNRNLNIVSVFIAKLFRKASARVKCD